jgi:hypothetical protein
MPANTLPDIKLSEAKRTQIVDYLYEQVTQALNDRSLLEDLWKEIQELYEKTELEEKKNFPFEGAAHIMIPVAPTYVEQIQAKIQNTLWAPEDPFSCKPTNPELLEFQRAVRKWLRWSAEEELELEDVTDSLFMEMLKLGDGPVKIVYTRETDTTVHFDEAEGKWVPVTEITKDCPEVIHIPANDFIYPAWAKTLDDAPWLAHRIRMSWNKMRKRAQQGHYNKDEVAKLQHWHETRQTDYDEHRSDLAMNTPTRMEEMEVFEVWFEFVLDEASLNDEPGLEDMNRELPMKLVGTFHKESKTLLRIQHNWFPLQLHPFEMCGYVRREHKISSIGVGQMTVPFQKEVSTMHNQRLDNATVANVVGYKYKSDSRVPGVMKLAPGRGIAVDAMDDFEPFSLGTKYDSTIAEEQHTIQFLLQRLGIDATMDMDMSSQAATTALSLMQERARRFDAIIRRVRKFMSRVVIKVVLLYQAYYPREKLIAALGEEDGSKVAALLQLPPRMLYEGLGIQLTATTSASSRETDRSSKLSLFNLLVQYYGQLVQYIMAMQNPQIPETARLALYAVVEGLSEFVQEILEDFNIRSKTDFTISIGELVSAAQTAATNPPAGTPGAPGLAAVPGGAGAQAQASGGQAA